MVSITVEVTGGRKLRRNLLRFGDTLVERVREVTIDSSLTIERGAKQDAPKNFARLSTAIRTEYTERETQARIGVFEGTRANGEPVNYAVYAHEGTRGQPRKFPPLEPLKLWALRKLLDEGAAYAVARKIWLQGTQGTPFLRDNWEPVAKGLPSKYQRAIQSAIRDARTK